jgi:hypothetical protein
VENGNASHANLQNVVAGKFFFFSLSPCFLSPFSPLLKLSPPLVTINSRKAKYCSKACQSKAWSDGHRWWCVERPNHNSHPPNPTATSSTTVAAAAAVVAAAPPPPPTEHVVHLEDNVVTSDVLAIPINGNHHTHTGQDGGEGDQVATTEHIRRASLPTMTVSAVTGGGNQQDTVMTTVNRVQPAVQQQQAGTGTGTGLFNYRQHQQQQRRNSRSVRSLASGSSTEVEADTDTSHDHTPRDLMDVD